MKKLSKLSVTVVSAVLSVSVLSACTGNVDAPQEKGNLAPISEGSLDPISEDREGLRKIDSKRINELSVGVARVTKQAAVFDSVDGVSIGRVAPGEYTAVGVVNGWIQIVIPFEADVEVEEDVNDTVTSATGWIAPNSVELKMTKNF